MLKLLVICGPSGSGKSTLEKNLIVDYPSTFNKLPQVSTREMRTNERFGDPYVFVRPDTFDFLKDRLIGRIIQKETDNLFTHQYGTIPDIKPNRVNTLILSADAIIDLKAQIANKKSIFKHYSSSEIKLFIIGLDVSYDDLDNEAKIARPERDANFLDREKEVLYTSNHVFKNSNGKYVQSKEIVELLKTHSVI